MLRRGSAAIRVWWAILSRNVEPRSLEIDKDVTLRPKAGIVIERPSRDIDDVTIQGGHRPAAHAAERPPISWPLLAYWRLVGRDERLSADPPKFRCLEDQFGFECGPSGFPAAGAMIEIKGGRCAHHLVPHCAIQAASFHG